MILKFKCYPTRQGCNFIHLLSNRVCKGYGHYSIAYLGICIACWTIQGRPNTEGFARYNALWTLTISIHSLQRLQNPIRVHEITRTPSIISLSHQVPTARQPSSY